MIVPSLTHLNMLFSCSVRGRALYPTMNNIWEHRVQTDHLKLEPRCLYAKAQAQQLQHANTRDLAVSVR